ncbi:SagB family peptide dehydrogenase [Paenibacillus vulneris]|uniref:SagB family peptide dehydrogenase n=1 Tax=Paenibacillus vulneris TaxID=1133364 RepID=A0ABW3UL33_9BACL
MSLDRFLHSLHTANDESRPPDWEVDWEDAPLTYKLYRGLPVVPLSAEMPLSLTDRPTRAFPDLLSLGHLLWYAYGLTRVSQFPAGVTMYGGTQVPMYRRFVPSGGGLYPNELYVYWKTSDVPEGIYHYDAAHHRLVLLREGNFDAYLTRALGGQCEMEGCCGAVMVSVMFWKNFYKYHNFAYRLQGLDTGVLIGQLREAARQFGYESALYYQFLDRGVNHLLGLSDREESVYAVIPLSAEPVRTWMHDEMRGQDGSTAMELCRELPWIRTDHYVRSQNVKEFPMLTAMNAASMLESTDSLGCAGAGKHADSGLRAVYLPEVERLSYDLASLCRQRYSPESDFVLKRVTSSDLAVLLREAADRLAYPNDSQSPCRSDPLVSLYCCLYNVEGIPDGAYRYDRTEHALRCIAPGDHRLRLQEGMSLHNVNLFQVPICIHVVGNRNYYRSAFGYRGYRMQQMEAGMLVHGLLLAASAIGMGGRPLLGFSPENSDDLYSLTGQGKTSLIQIPIGHYRQRPRLEGGLHS